MAVEEAYITKTESLAVEEASIRTELRKPTLGRRNPWHLMKRSLGRRNPWHSRKTKSLAADEAFIRKIESLVVEEDGILGN